MPHFNHGKPYGVKYSKSAGREGRLQVFEKHFATQKALDAFVAKVEQSNGFKEFLGWRFPREELVDEATDSNGMTIPDSSTEEMQEVNNAVGEILKKYFGGKAWFKAGGYAYLFDVTRPTVILTSDGGKLSTSSWAEAIDGWADEYIADDFFQQVYYGNFDKETALEFFRPVKASPMMKDGGPKWGTEQERHELDQMGLGEMASASASGVGGIATGPAGSLFGKPQRRVTESDRERGWLADSILWRIERQKPEWFTRYGVEYVTRIAQEVGDSYESWYEEGGEIGSSDIGALVRDVERQLVNAPTVESKKVKGAAPIVSEGRVQQTITTPDWHIIEAMLSAKFEIVDVMNEAKGLIKVNESAVAAVRLDAKTDADEEIKITIYRNPQDPNKLTATLGESDEGITEDEGGTNFDADAILERLSKSYYKIARSDAYSAAGKNQVRSVYELLRDPLMKEDEAEFSKMWDYASGKYPDAFDELCDDVAELYITEWASDDEKARQQQVDAFLKAGGQIKTGKLHKPRKSEKWQGSAHIGKEGSPKTRGKAAALTGKAANVNTKGSAGKPVVTAGKDNSSEPINELDNGPKGRSNTDNIKYGQTRNLSGYSASKEELARRRKAQSAAKSEKRKAYKAAMSAASKAERAEAARQKPIDEQEAFSAVANSPWITGEPDHITHFKQGYKKVDGVTVAASQISVMTGIDFERDMGFGPDMAGTAEEIFHYVVYRDPKVPGNIRIQYSRS